MEVRDGKNVRLCRMLGLSRRAGRLACGMDAALTAIRQKRARLVLLACDASARTVKTARDKSDFYKIPLRVLPLTRTALGQACGIPEMSVGAVLDDSFAASLSSLTEVGGEGEAASR